MGFSGGGGSVMSICHVRWRVQPAAQHSLFADTASAACASALCGCVADVDPLCAHAAVLKVRQHTWQTSLLAGAVLVSSLSLVQ
jgi:hypothetical protein